MGSSNWNQRNLFIALAILIIVNIVFKVRCDTHIDSVAANIPMHHWPSNGVINQPLLDIQLRHRI
jgi:hypothetical protein